MMGESERGAGTRVKAKDCGCTMAMQGYQSRGERMVRIGHESCSGSKSSQKPPPEETHGVLVPLVSMTG